MEHPIRKKVKEVINQCGGKVLLVDKKLLFVKIQCSQQHQFYQKPRSVINGSWCPYCAKSFPLRA